MAKKDYRRNIFLRATDAASVIKKAIEL